MITFNNNSQFRAEFSSSGQKMVSDFDPNDQTAAAVFDQIFTGSTGKIDYSRAINKPQINGVELSGNKTSSDLGIVSENTTEGWSANPQYLPKAGEICIYTDYMTVKDDLGRDITFPGIKVGDGNSYLVDMPFVGAETRYLIINAIREHESNTQIHITQNEREFWNNKLNYDIAGDELILTRN